MPENGERMRTRVGWTLRRLAVALLCAAAVSAAAETPALRAARAALEDGFADLAERQLRGFLAAGAGVPDDAATASILLARALHAQRKYSEMLNVLAGQTNAPAAFWRGLARYETAQYDAALLEVSEADRLATEPEQRAQAERLRAHCLIGAGRTNEAMEAFSRFETRYGAERDGPANLLEWATALAGARQDEKEREVLGLLVRRSPDSNEGQIGRLMLGRLAVIAREWKEAESQLAGLLDQERAAPGYRTSAGLALAEALTAQSRTGEVAGVLLRVIRVAPDPASKRRAEIALGRHYLQAKKPEDALPLLKRYIAAVPPDALADSLQLEVASAFLESGAAVRAAEEYQSYLETFTNRAGRAAAFNGRGWALLQQSKPAFEEAAGAFLQAVDLLDDPGDKVKCLVKAGDAYFGNRQFQLAAQTYARVWKDYREVPLAIQARYQEGESQARAGRLDEAEQLFREVNALRAQGPFGEQALIRVAEIVYDRGQLRSALATYDQFMRTYTNSALFVTALQARGLICYRLFLFDDALDAFERVVKLAPPGEAAEQAFYMRGWCHQMLGRTERALSTCREFIRLFPESKWAPRVRFWLGESAFNQGDFKEAEAQFLTAAEKHPDDPLAQSALLWAGKAAASQKEYLRATEHLALLAKRYPTSARLPRARYAQGDALTELGEFSNAILIFEEIIRKYPDNEVVPLAWLRKGDCEYALGREAPVRYTAAMESYAAVDESAAAGASLKLQARFKTGLCLRKLGRNEEALERFYAQVVLVYASHPADEFRQDPDNATWFTRGAFEAVDILESLKRWREAVRVLKRVVDAGVPAAKEARERMDRLRLQHWIVVY